MFDSLGDASGTLGLAAGFTRDDTRVLVSAAKELVSSGKATGVVMGHTHELVDSPTYINSGSWTRDATPETCKLADWRLLRAGNRDRFAYSLRYAVLRAEQMQSCTFQEYRHGV